MGMTASASANRVTVWLTNRQHDYVLAGMRRFGIGLSEFVRRKFDEVIDGEQPPAVAPEREDGPC